MSIKMFKLSQKTAASIESLLPEMREREREREREWILFLFRKNVNKFSNLKMKKNK